MSKCHYVYKLTDLKTKQFYFGSRTCNCDPEEDDYMGSPCTWKPNYSNLEKEIIKSNFKTRADAINYEAQLIEKHINDKLNENYYIPDKGFYNGEKRKGKVIVTDGEGNNFLVDTNDPRFIEGDLIHPTKGTVPVKNNKGEHFRVSKDDPRLKSGELVHQTKGTLVAKDENGNNFNVNINDKRLQTGELVPINKNKIPVKDENGNTFQIDKNDPRWLSGELKHVTKGNVPWNKGKTHMAGKDNPSSKKVIHVKTGKTFSTIKEAANYFNLADSTISNHCHKRVQSPKFKFV